jgi:hypothetical protein
MKTSEAATPNCTQDYKLRVVMPVTVKNCSDFSVPFMSPCREELMKKRHFSGTPVLLRGSQRNNTGEREESVTENRKRNRNIIKIKKYEHLFIEANGISVQDIRYDTAHRHHEDGRRGTDSHRQ